MMEHLDSDKAEPTADNATSEIVARLLMGDLAPIGDVTLERRLNGFALLEDGVMFCYVAADATPYLRATAEIAQQFHALGSHKHHDMRYWSIPHSISADIARLRQIAYEAADTAHLALSFGIDDTEPIAPTRTTSVRSLFTIALLAA